jgi:hypothetical protein
VPGALISGLIRLLPSAVTGPRLLKEAMVSVPVFNALPCKLRRKFRADFARLNNSARSFVRRIPS